MKRVIKIYIQGFKYSRRLAKLYKTLDILLKEFDATQSLENKKFLYKSITELHDYTSDLLKEFDSYIETNKFRRDIK